MLADPWSTEEGRLAITEQRLRRAAEFLPGPTSDSTSDSEDLLPAMLVQAKWGAVLQRLGRRAEAEACYRG
jgi:hypothetical protein